MPDKNSVEDHLGNSYPTLTIPCNRRFYKYKGHIFTHKEGLLAYAGLMPTEYWFIEKDVVVI